MHHDYNTFSYGAKLGLKKLNYIECAFYLCVYAVGVVENFTTYNELLVYN